jgi:predicted amidohydrolase YtcJ
MGVSLHVLWANSAAIEAAGIDTGTPDPSEGIIERGSDGRLTGLFFEEAMRLFDNVLLPPSGEKTLRLFEHAQQSLWSMGITGVHDFDRIPCFITLQTLRQHSRLKLRVVKNLPVESLDELIASGLRTGLGDDLLRIGAVKAFADGALGARTAAMLEPYLDNRSNRGMLRLDAEGLLEIGQRAAANGFGLTIHAIGDAANHEILNGFEQLRKLEEQHGWPHYRHRIEHVQLLHPEDLDRLADLDLIASMQPIHCTSDIEMADTGWGDRSRYAYAWQTLLTHGTRLTFGSDSPVDSPNPFYGLHAAVTRQKAGGAPDPEGWYPQERISLHAALTAYTSGPAYTSSREDRLGKLAAGFLADLIVLDENPFDLPPADLRDLRPVATMVGGEWVYRQGP